MVQTFDSSQYLVRDTDSLSHETDSPLTVQSSECRWQGSTQTDVTGIATYDASQQSFSAGDSYTWSFTVPEYQDAPWRTNWSFSENNFALVYKQSGDLTIDVTIDYTLTFSGGEVYQDRSRSVTRSLSSTGPDQDRIATHYLNLEGVYEQQYDASDKMVGGTYEATVTLDSISGATSVTMFPDVNTLADFDAKTHDPAVDVNGGAGSASYTGTLDDGEYTSWTPMGGVAEGTNTFDHTMADDNQNLDANVTFRTRYDSTLGGSFDRDSTEANWEFRYDYIWEVPEPKAVVRTAVDGTEVDIALADLTDTYLEYDVVRMAANDGTVYAVDLTDTTSESASGLRIQTQKGTLAVRDNPRV